MLTEYLMNFSNRLQAVTIGVFIIVIIGVVISIVLDHRNKDE